MNRRAYVRISLKRDFREADKILEAFVVWPGQGRLDIYDMSFGGAAIGRPRDFEARVGEKLQLQFVLGSAEPVFADIEVAWSTPTAIGFKLVNLSVEARRVFDHFLQDQVVGASMRLVDRQYFAPNLDCEFWYHGPRDTNVMLWPGLQRVVIEMGDDVLQIENNDLVLNGRSSEDAELRRFLSRAVALLTQMSDPEGPMRPLITLLSGKIR